MPEGEDSWRRTGYKPKTSYESNSYSSSRDRSSNSNSRQSSWSRGGSTGGRPTGGSRGSSFDKNKSGTWGSSGERVELPAVDFLKNFYMENENITKTSDSKITAFRDENAMKLKGTNIPKPIFNFSDLNLPEGVTNEFKNRGYETPTPIQSQGWPMAISGRDMVGIAQTGSGKTISFVLPALIHAKAQEPLRKNDGPIVLILSPTRELCLQIQTEIEIYAKYYRLRSLAVYGGVSSIPQKQSLNRGVEILVATPGRLIDLYEQGAIFLNRVTFLVLDEADRMLDMGFEIQLRKIIPKTNNERQTLMWSATWPKEVKNLAESYMKDYIQVNIGSESLSTNAKITQEIAVISSQEKKERLMATLAKHKDLKTIIFCNMKRTCDELEWGLRQSKFNAIAIHGDKSQQSRDSIIADFKRGRSNTLIATDVAARGLDVKDVKLVINYDFPNNCEDYVHRIGRTARGNEANGKSITFFTSADRNAARDLIKLLVEANQEVPSELKSMSSDNNSGRNYSRPGTYGTKSRYGGSSSNSSRKW